MPADKISEKMTPEFFHVPEVINEKAKNELHCTSTRLKKPRLQSASRMQDHSETIFVLELLSHLKTVDVLVLLNNCARQKQQHCGMVCRVIF